ncbi:sortase [Candidatus Dojkabacteria bacterium]|nr:sortase [Candidatus Dojkabacteria bacterium]
MVITDRANEVVSVRSTKGTYTYVYREELYLTIPSIGLNEYVGVGRDGSESLKEGLWHIPYTYYPGENGNVVIAGHSINYGSLVPPSFFYLHRVERGDTVEIEYKGRLFTYKVTNKSVVKPNDISVESSHNGEEILTLYTCTPILNPINRLVVTANLVSID